MDSMEEEGDSNLARDNGDYSNRNWGSKSRELKPLPMILT